MRIALIGAGNVATHIGRALAKTGHQILQVYSRTEASAAELAKQINQVEGSESEGETETDEETASVKGVKGEKTRLNLCIAEKAPYTRGNIRCEEDKNRFEEQKCSWTTSLSEITPEADLYLVMLKDSVLNDLLPQLVKRNPNALFVHTAGSVPMSIWEGLANRYGVLYPMQTFSKLRAVDFEQVHFFVEAKDASDVALLKSLAGELSSHVVEASSEQRKYLHLSAVFACNFTNHMYAICEELLTSHGLPFSSMFPLIDETARKVHLLSPKESQTGPAQRNDVNVMQKQENLLKADAVLNDPVVAEIYRKLSNHIVHYQQKLKLE